ncbi:Tumor necrosis factor ligand superfamily member 13 [Eumeta japonica]|uniref:Tumor necrosis factor ligand superfamily member 13 n=1 Tax=Eumeta variegata TaxID=151549 RepID=A0A4C1SB66_EUMVA|nr:Tumor necrosis factor ligand superfamily member 13 [Eumeta japonica]
MHQNCQNVKKYESKEAEIGEEDEGRRLSPAPRTPRNTDEEGGRRPFVAAHFHGNTSHLTLGVDAHYHGNGLVRTPHEEVHSVWWPAAWTAAAPRPRPTLSGRGRVLVHRSGVYLVYVQVYYFDAHDTVGWVLHRTNAEREGRDALLQCTHAAPSVDHEEKPNSCFSAAALLLHAGDRLAVRNTGGERHAIMNSEKSFIGLVQLADADDPEAVEL